MEHDKPGRCGIPLCPGYHVKYPDCLTEALSLTSEWCNEQTGDTEAFGVYVMLNLIDDEQTITADMSGMDNDVIVPARTYCLVLTVSSGAVTRLDYDTAEQAQEAYDLWAEQYGGFLEREDARETAIMRARGGY